MSLMKSFLAVAKSEWELARQHEEEQIAISLFTVIPALPRNALVEWHVTAMPGTLSRRDYHAGFEGDDFNISAHFQLIEDLDNGRRIFKSSLNVASTMNADAINLSNVVSIWEALFCIIKSKLDDLNMKYSDLECPRVFYLSHKTSFCVLTDACTKASTKVFQTAISVLEPAFIPVAQTGSNDTILSVCI